MSIFYTLLNHKQQQLQHQQQSAATMPSKSADTGKCQCFNNPTPLMLAAVEWLLSHVCSSVRQRRPVGAMPGIQQARTMHTQAGGTRRRHSTHNPADSLVPFCQTSPTPEHPSTSATTHRTASPPNRLSLETELQHLRLCWAGRSSWRFWKKRHKDL